MGVLAPAPISQLSMELLSFPLVPVVVENKTTPSEVLVFTPFMLQYLIVLFVASFMNCTVYPYVEVLIKDNCLVFLNHRVDHQKLCR